MDTSSIGLKTELLELAIELAAEAAQLINSARPGEFSVTTKSSPTDLVTEIDAACEQVIVDGILEARPEDGILGEEGSSISGTSGVRWVIDPIDGTTNFLYGFPSYSVSIAVEVDGRTEAAVVHDPLRNQVFTATLGGGAYLDNCPISVRSAVPLDEALISTGFGYRPEHRKAQAQVLLGLITEVRDIRRAGSAALDLCWVAQGHVDGYYERGLNPWDHGAGVLIVNEAGGTTGDLDGGIASSEMTIATSPEIFEQLRNLLAKLDAATG